MAQRAESKDSLDDFPPPPWATRALIEHVIEDKGDLAGMSCLEPACGRGAMANVLKDYFGTVQASDDPFSSRATRRHVRNSRHTMKA
jgi:hypothetical protein